MAIMTTSTTVIEILLKEALERENVEFKEQYRIYEKGNSFHPKYVVDFLVTFGKKSVIVECDGFSYHESDADVDADIQRDAWLTEHGYTVLHFTAFQLKYEMKTVIRNIKYKLGMEKYSPKELSFQGRKIRKEYVVNCPPNEKLHKVSLYYNYTRVKDRVWIAYKFRDDTLKKCSEERVKVFHNVPENAADVLAIYTALSDLKKSVNLTVYCLSGWLSGYLNRTIENRENSWALIEKIEGILKAHNYLFKHINTKRGPGGYNRPKTEQFIARELRSRCLQMCHDKTGAWDKCDVNFLDIEKRVE